METDGGSREQQADNAIEGLSDIVRELDLPSVTQTAEVQAAVYEAVVAIPTQTQYVIPAAEGQVGYVITLVNENQQQEETNLDPLVTEVAGN